MDLGYFLGALGTFVSAFPQVVVVWFFVCGLIVGSFLNVVIYRFHTGKSLEGRSRCLSCGHTLSWLCLFPVVSYLALRGRCAYCYARISPRYMLVELLTGAFFGLVAISIDGALLRAVYLVFMSVLVLVLVYDLLHTIIPDEFVVLLLLCAGALVGLDTWSTGDSYTLALRVLAGAVGFLFFASLWLVSEGRWIGLGDAKLAIPLGIILSWPQVISALILSFWIGAAISVALLVLQRIAGPRPRRTRPSPLFLSDFADRSTAMLTKCFRLPFAGLTIKSEVPFAPFLIAGFLLVHFFNVNVFTLIAQLLSF